MREKIQQILEAEQRNNPNGTKTKESQFLERLEATITEQSIDAQSIDQLDIKNTRTSHKLQKPFLNKKSKGSKEAKRHNGRLLKLGH
jgi:hypothetical protein